MEPTNKISLNRHTSIHNIPLFRSESCIMDNFSKIISNNKCWAEECVS